MSADMKQWLARPSTITTSTTSQATFSFPTLSSSTTDWLKHPISSVPSITMTTTPPKDTETIAPPSSVQGIQMWLKSIEPFDSIEDDFEIVDEDTSSVDDCSITLDNKDHIRFPVKTPVPEESMNSDLDIWLKKDKNQEISISAEHGERFDYDSGTFHDKLEANIENELPVDGPSSVKPGGIKTTSDKEIWIISQDKSVEKPTIMECDMFNQLRQESNNLMDWVKKEFKYKPGMELGAYNPLNAWNNFQKSIVWVQHSYVGENKHFSTTDKLTCNADEDSWLHKPSAMNASDKPNIYLQEKVPLISSDMSYDKWLKKDNPLSKNESEAKHSLCNWDELLRPSNADSIEKWLKPTVKEKSAPMNEKPNKSWLLTLDEAPASNQLKPINPYSNVNKDDYNIWLHKDAKNTTAPEEPIEFSFEQSGKWLFQKK